MTTAIGVVSAIFVFLLFAEKFLPQKSDGYTQKQVGDYFLKANHLILIFGIRSGKRCRLTRS